MCGAASAFRHVTVFPTDVRRVAGLKAKPEMATVADAGAAGGFSKGASARTWSTPRIPSSS